jgi:hypothetical protein
VKSCRHCYSNDDATYALDRYVLDTLMADLVGHDHKPSAFLVYLAITAAHAEGKAVFSHAQLAERTGLSRRTAQSAVDDLEAEKPDQRRSAGTDGSGDLCPADALATSAGIEP